MRDQVGPVGLAGLGEVALKWALQPRQLRRASAMCGHVGLTGLVMPTSGSRRVAWQRSVVRREHLTALTDLIVVNVNVRHRGVGNPPTRTVVSRGYRCVTDSISSVAG